MFGAPGAGQAACADGGKVAAIASVDAAHNQWRMLMSPPFLRHSPPRRLQTRRLFPHWNSLLMSDGWAIHEKFYIQETIAILYAWWSPWPRDSGRR
jgi:hypothetical protein